MPKLANNYQKWPVTRLKNVEQKLKWILAAMGIRNVAICVAGN